MDIQGMINEVMRIKAISFVKFLNENNYDKNLSDEELEKAYDNFEKDEDHAAYKYKNSSTDNGS